MNFCHFILSGATKIRMGRKIDKEFERATQILHSRI